MTFGETYISIENVTLGSTGKIFALGVNTEGKEDNLTASFLAKYWSDIVFNNSVIQREYVLGGKHSAFYFTGLEKGTTYVVYLLG